jgi:hypothetical protein
MNDQFLRALYALTLARPARALDRARVSVERVLALVERRGSEAERLRTLDLVMRDRDHMIELDVLRSAAGVRQGTSWHFRFAAAAAIIIAAGALGRVAQERATADDVARGGRAPLVRLIAPGERVGNDAITFSWVAVGGARDYEIEVLDADGLSAFVSTVRGTSVRLPTDVRLRPGQEYRWWVVARRADGSRIGAVPRRLRLDTGIEGGPPGSVRSPGASPRSMLAAAAADAGVRVPL